MRRCARSAVLRRGGVALVAAWQCGGCCGVAAWKALWHGGLAGGERENGVEVWPAGRGRMAWRSWLLYEQEATNALKYEFSEVEEY
uniref:Secreted protein n=1 Tax=Fagus sylvatica TaxID=28930 RepID=A0A2N9EQZ5_FAGSY